MNQIYRQAVLCQPRDHPILFDYQIFETHKHPKGANQRKYGIVANHRVKVEPHNPAHSLIHSKCAKASKEIYAKVKHCPMPIHIVMSDIVSQTIQVNKIHDAISCIHHNLICVNQKAESGKDYLIYPSYLILISNYTQIK